MQEVNLTRLTMGCCVGEPTSMDSLAIYTKNKWKLALTHQQEMFFL